MLELTLTFNQDLYASFTRQVLGDFSAKIQSAQLCLMACDLLIAFYRFLTGFSWRDLAITGLRQSCGPPCSKLQIMKDEYQTFSSELLAVDSFSYINAFWQNIKSNTYTTHMLLCLIISENHNVLLSCFNKPLSLHQSVKRESVNGQKRQNFLF